MLNDYSPANKLDSRTRLFEVGFDTSDYSAFEK